MKMCSNSSSVDEVSDPNLLLLRLVGVQFDDSVRFVDAELRAGIYIYIFTKYLLKRRGRRSERERARAQSNETPAVHVYGERERGRESIFAVEAELSVE